MSVNPQIIFGCDHYIQESQQIYGTIEMIRNSEPTGVDQTPDNINIVRIDRIYKYDNNGNEIEFFNSYHYNQTVSNNVVEWIPNAPNIPEYNSKYYIQCLYVKISVEKYPDEQCPRCGGNGWYVSMMNDTNRSIKKVDGITKLLQEFIKVLHTDKGPDGYGSELNNVITKSVHDPTKIYSEIIASILDCGEQIKIIQKKAAINGIDITDEERLSNIVVNKIQYAREENTFYVSVSIYNVAGKSAKFNFRV